MRPRKPTSSPPKPAAHAQQFGVIGDRVRSRRKAAGLTQFQLAVMTGIGITKLSAIEMGHKDVTARSLVLLARGLGVSTDYLVGLSSTARRSR